jgi:hypothetical protein
MNSNTRNIVVIGAIIVAVILAYTMLGGGTTAPVPASTTAPVDTTQPATQ